MTETFLYDDMNGKFLSTFDVPLAAMIDRTKQTRNLQCIDN